MSFTETNKNHIKYLAFNTDFINKDDVIVTSFDHSNQTSDYLVKKFKFFRNEKENLKLLKTHSANLFKNNFTKEKGNEKFNTKSNIETFHNTITNTENTFYNNNTSSNIYSKYQNTTENYFKNKKNLAKFIEDDFGYKIKYPRQNLNLEKCLSTYDINETLPSLFDKSRENEKLSHRSNLGKTLNSNLNMLKFYKTKKKNESKISKSPFNNSPSNKIKKIILTEIAEPNKKLFMKKIEFNLIRNKKIINDDTLNEIKRKSNENKNHTKRLFLDYINQINYDRHNTNDSYPRQVYKSTKKKYN